MGELVDPASSEQQGRSCIYGFVFDRARSAPDAPAVAAPGRETCSYGELAALIRQVVDRLNAAGVGRGDRVALVLPNGPEMAAAFFSVSAAATCAPLNPAYRAPEFEFYFDDLDPACLVILQGMESPARAVARQRGVPVLDLAPLTGGPAGAFELRGESGRQPVETGPASAEDVALVLHTSGTTSRPKMVPLTHRNLSTSARNVRDTLELTGEDRALVVMPLFHIHGLVGATLSSLAAGASVACTPPFSADRFFEWMDACRPTFYSAVPTMHQAILERAPENRAVIERNPLRLVRSSSASLAPVIMQRLEETFDAPVLEAYGMTEAAHQICSNPLPPAARKPGTVGPPAGPQMAVMDEEGNLLPAGRTGEIVIRGDNVTRGYEGNPEANAAAFAHGWFHTGDQGHVDEDGYLTITGRLKEIINRGGENISPREIDEVLLDHPAVAQAVAFAVPDPELGEDVAAAVVLRPGRTVREGQVRAFAAERLAHFKVPRLVLFLDEIPKGPTGKLQRIGLAGQLGLEEAASAATVQRAGDRTPPRTPLEERIAALWGEVLGLEAVGVDESFLDLGGNSLLAAQIISRLERDVGVEMPVFAFFEQPTVAGMAETILCLQMGEMDEAALEEALSDLEGSKE